MFEKLLKKKNKIYINYLYYKDLIKAKVHAFLKRVHKGLKTTQIKFASFRLWVNRGFDHISNFIDDVETGLGTWLENYRYKKLDIYSLKIQESKIKYENKIQITKDKLGII